jgi:hypothetical protein
MPYGVWHFARVELWQDRIRVLMTAATLTPHPHSASASA